MCYLFIDLSPLISQLCIADDRRRDNPTTLPNRQSQGESQGESNSGEGSGLLFSVYSKAAEDVDKNMAEHWQKDAKEIVIFVSPSVDIHTSSQIIRNALDRSILCRSLGPSCCFRPGPETKQSGYLGFLPRQHLSGPGRPERNTLIYSFPSRKIALILSSEICRLGEYSLVLELGDELELCIVGDIVTTMGTSIYRSGSACPVQSGKASSDACILCRGRGQDAYSVGS